MLTTIDLPVISHVTRASTSEPFLGMMLTLDARSILQLASEMDEPRPRREHAYRAISFEALDGTVLLSVQWRSILRVAGAVAARLDGALIAAVVVAVATFDEADVDGPANANSRYEYVVPCSNPESV